MARANVVVKIEGLDALEAFVERLEKVMADIEEIGRPLYGDVHVNAGVDYARLADVLDEGRTTSERIRQRATDGVKR